MIKESSLLISTNPGCSVEPKAAANRSPPVLIASNVSGSVWVLSCLSVSHFWAVVNADIASVLV